MKAKQVLVHVLVTSCGYTLKELQPLVDGLVKVAAKFDPEYAVRIKRRRVSERRALRLRALYEARADLPLETIITTGDDR